MEALASLSVPASRDDPAAPHGGRTLRDLSARLDRIAPSATSGMRTIANELKARGVPVANFAAGELDFTPPDIVKRKGVAAIEANHSTYTATLGLPALREELARWMSKRTDCRYEAGEIALTAGAKQALFNAASVLIDPYDEAIIPAPYWVTFPTQIALQGGTPVFIDTKPRGYRLLARDVERAVSPRTRMILLNSPHNPTGTVIAERELEAIGRLAVERDLWVIFDECYASFVREGSRHRTIVELVPEAKDRTILVNSFSKTLAVTGWRLGYAAGPAHVVSAMAKLQGHTTSNPNSVSQHALSGCLGTPECEAFIDVVNAELGERLDAATAILSDVPGVSWAPAEGAFYIFLDVSSAFGRRSGTSTIRDVDHFCEVALEEAKVALVAGSAFGDASSVRISYAIARRDLIDGLSRLSDFLKALH